MLKYFKNDIFTNSKVFGIDVGKWFIYWLGKSGITTVDTCCSDGTQTIDEKIEAIQTSITEIEADLPAPLGYKEYEALITQTGTSAPTAIIGSNTLLGTPVLGYSAIGEYTITLTGAFTVNKTYVYMTPNKIDFPYIITRTSSDVITIVVGYSFALPPAINGKMNNTPVRIRVYN